MVAKRNRQLQSLGSTCPHCLKQITIQDLLYSTENSSQCYMVAWMGGEFEGERIHVWASQVVLVVKDPPTSAGDVRNVGSVPGLGRSPGGGHGNPLQYFCLENPMDRGAWRAAAHGIAKKTTKQLSTAYTVRNKTGRRG